MYRTPSPPETTPPPSTFLYVSKERKRGPAQLVLQVATLPLLLAGVAGALVGPAAAGAAFVVSGGLVWYGVRAKVDRVLLSVEGDVLTVSRDGAKGPPLLRVTLEELTDVELDTETVRDAIEGGSAIPAMRLVDMRQGVAVDVTRIVLVTSSGARIPLSKDRRGHTETSETFGKMRVFLRKHGWLPTSEREPASR